MGWMIGFDSSWDRWVGYGVPAYCDHPDCSEEIDRGLFYVCGAEPYGGDRGCGLYFCYQHRAGAKSLCARCENEEPPYEPKPEHPRWVHHIINDESWAGWRMENPEAVAAIAPGLTKGESA